jgi:hypothetical protein
MITILRTSFEQVWSGDEENGSAADDACPLPESGPVSPLVVLLLVLLDNIFEGLASLGSLFVAVGSLYLTGTWWWRSRLRNATSVFGERFGAC